ncbi:hypothetical protein SARC_08742, partial [Sphaeroforma arctica JP610]
KQQAQTPGYADLSTNTHPCDASYSGYDVVHLVGKTNAHTDHSHTAYSQLGSGGDYDTLDLTDTTYDKATLQQRVSGAEFLTSGAEYHSVVSNALTEVA